ncbi:MAG TPA: ferritin-like domain-containing protein [Vicinamibacterales bacterium]|nr:ferritin-like domain-containing protein [Vicinamibacterales bacterium]
MPKIDSLDTLLVEQLRDIYDAERRLTTAIPKMVQAATSEELSSALSNHLIETQNQVARLEEAFGMLGEVPSAKACAGMRGIIEEGEEHVGEEYEDDSLRDAVIIGAAQRVEHYEMAAYGTAIAHARMLGRDDVADLLEQSLNEEKNADETLTQVAETCVNIEALTDEDEPAESNERDGLSERPSANGARARSTRGR